MLRRTSLLRRWLQLGAAGYPSIAQTYSARPVLDSFCSAPGSSQCLTCGPRERASLSTSVIAFKKRKSKDEKSSVSLNPKGLKKEKNPVVGIWKNMTVQELADVLEKDIDDLYEIFLFVDNSDPYDRPQAVIDNLKVIQDSVKKAGFRFKIEGPPNEKEKLKEYKDAVRRPPAKESELVRRPPVVTIMGHVDHGKTTLLDSLRHSSIVDTEFGGITQHIGAFSVKLDSGDEVTFLDTPGHAAFRAMRARGANVTDMVVLVVAADDGVMEQTKESIQFAHNAKVPIIVAINKIDKAGADLSQAKRDLLECGLQLEEDGGDVQAVPVSALKGQNLDLLVEALATQAELLNLRADPLGFVEAVVVESRTDPGRGKVATCIIQRGTLRKGAVLVAGRAWAKVRNMFSDGGKPIKAAPPGTPVQVIGWRDLPSAGDEVLEVESEYRATEVMHWRDDMATKEKEKEELIAIQEKLNEHLKVYRAQLEERRRLGIRYKVRRKEPREKEIKEIATGPKVSIVLKGDVDGSIEAILDVLETYHSEECDLDIISYGVGMVTPNDITMAATFSGLIYAFNTAVPPEIRKMALEKKVTIKETNIIYRLVEDLKEELSEQLPLKDVEEVLGEANLLAEFVVTEGKKKIPVAGCRCVKGTLKKDALYRVIRGQDIIHEGPLLSMRHHKSEVETVNRDKECGLMFEDETLRFEPGDQIICYKINKVKQITDWDPGF
ncbi:translation initiation factor IF-2, mitochondrial-like isoform X2 [Penaeus chinensis]|uniref:translation initiation factor IF-2, mitochondrial-like isoform X2 n=1 Tax=Penaeus chinensis TaxID=139456 RepID=UPI001FB70AAA|nr:translation initiation factor IF-2, mitochondrial-like isoform X2 [Penaeus chinensis]